MRVLRYLLISSAVILLLAAVLFLVTREALLYWGVATLRQSLSQLQRSSNQSSYSIECKRRGLSVGGQEVLQLRFTSSNEYVLEALCSEGSRDPILIERQELPPFVQKVSGTSGFVWDSGKSGVELKVFAALEGQLNSLLFNHGEWITRSKSLVVDNRIVYENQEIGEPGSGPATSCVGYGYQCCQDVSHFGVGDRLIGVYDCEKTCYSACVSRPVILSFTSNPFFDIKTRTIAIKHNATVEFLYVADEGQASSVSALLTFGDGKSEKVSGTANAVNHKYTCDKERCEYTAQLKLTDNWDITSAETPVSTITVIVTQ